MITPQTEGLFCTEKVILVTPYFIIRYIIRSILVTSVQPYALTESIRSVTLIPYSLSSLYKLIESVGCSKIAKTFTYNVITPFL